MINSRNKGKTGELEFAKVILDELGVKLTRNLCQTQNGGCDLIVADSEYGEIAHTLRTCSIEVKRVKRMTPGMIAGFWSQAVSQAGEETWPVLAYRENGNQWRVVVALSMISEYMPRGYHLTNLAELTAEGFCTIVREL